jgi:hypothetical protein
MALQSSGEISLNDIATEFSGTAPHSLSEYYGVDTGIPSSGEISFSDFYGATSTTTHTVSPTATIFTSGVAAPRADSGYTTYTYTFTISPGISISSSVKFFCENGGNKSSYVIMNDGQSNQASSSSGASYPVVSFSGLWTSFKFIYSTADHDGDDFGFGVLQLDGSSNFTVVNTSTLTIP